MADAFMIRLGREETAYLLRALKIATVPGFAADSLGALNADQQALALAVADRSLRARGVIRVTGPDDRQIEKFAASLLRAYAEPEFTITLERWHAGAMKARQAYLVCNRHLAVVQFVPEPGIHEFLALGVANEARQTIASFLATQKPLDPGASSGFMPSALWEKRRTSAQITPEAQQAAARLAPELAEALVSPQMVATVSLWPHIPGDERAERPLAQSSLLASATALWYVQPHATDQVALIPVPFDDALDRVMKLLSPALDVLPAAPSAHLTR